MGSVSDIVDQPTRHWLQNLYHRNQTCQFISYNWLSITTTFFRSLLVPPLLFFHFYLLLSIFYSFVSLKTMCLYNLHVPVCVTLCLVAETKTRKRKRKWYIERLVSGIRQTWVDSWNQMGYQHFLFVLVFLFVCLSVFVLFCLVPLPVRWFNLLDIEFCLVIEKTTKLKIWAVPISGFRK